MPSNDFDSKRSIKDNLETMWDDIDVIQKGIHHLDSIKEKTDKITDLKTQTDKITTIQTQTDKITEIKTQTDKITNFQMQTEQMQGQIDTLQRTIDELQQTLFPNKSVVPEGEFSKLDRHDYVELLKEVVPKSIQIIYKLDMDKLLVKTVYDIINNTGDDGRTYGRVVDSKTQEQFNYYYQACVLIIEDYCSKTPFSLVFSHPKNDSAQEGSFLTGIKSNNRK